MGEKLTELSIRRPKRIFAIVIALVVGLGSQISRIVVDTDPENMLSAEQPERVFHDQIEERFGLWDMIVVGVVNDEHPEGVFNVASLEKIHKLTRAIEEIDGVIRQDVMSPATVDNITQEGPGTIRFEWMMSAPPANEEGALAVREAAQRLPILNGTVVSEDGSAVAVYVPIREKSESYRISQEIQKVADDLGGPEEYHITGLPVAEDTFGVEMFKQMAVAAPLSAAIIFLMMLLFFRSVSLIASPMLLAMATVIATMGLLIGAGFTVHIMSSMIPIFLMPIAVVDSVHILSEFSDRYRPGKDPKEVVREIMKHLFTPMLYTSLTSIAGFASLAFTPIPPVKVFGVFVAVGIGLAWILTVTFIPAYVVSLSPRQLDKLIRGAGGETGGEGPLGRLLDATGRFVLRRGKLVLGAALAIVGVSVYGITRIQINDNPVRWFKKNHRIRVADRVLNEHFAGTYSAFFVLSFDNLAPVRSDFERQSERILREAAAAGTPIEAKWKALKDAAGDDWGVLAAKIDDLLFDTSSAGAEYWEELLRIVEETQGAVKYFQSPEALAYMEKLQRELERTHLVGKSNSLADIVKTVYRELLDGRAESYRIPDSSSGVAQALLSYQSSHRPGDLWHFVTPDYRSAAVWVQLKSGDNQDMSFVVRELERFIENNPPPVPLETDWAGLTYINVVWQHEMVTGMLKSLMGSFLIVLVMMIVLFRSFWFGLLAMIPLTITIAFIYGLIGLVGKDYDMPVAVLSSLTLGLSVDFAIHFLQRVREIFKQCGDWKTTIAHLFSEPARAISRNALVIAIGFLPLLVAPLVPYVTVGFFLSAIMAVSSVVTLVLLPAIVHPARRRLFGAEAAHCEADY